MFACSDNYPIGVRFYYAHVIISLKHTKTLKKGYSLVVDVLIFILTSGWLLEMSHRMIEDEGDDLSYANTCMMIISF